jgi:malonate-semialdehyde dehydrogenase (acetylating) / methylmalonate-semialdehyde dehydrogenase
MRQVDHFISGGTGTSTGRKHAIWNPSTGEVQAEVGLGDAALLDRAVENAKKVQPEWAMTNPQKRARVMFKFKELVEANRQELAELLASEHGKVVEDAQGDIQRGLEVIEYACGIPQVLKGEYTIGAGPGIDVYSARQPLGIGAGITPFNFPAMIPMWMFGMAIAAGNAFITATRRWSMRSSTIPISPRSASSARPISRTMSTSAVSRRGSASRRWAGPRTTASSCPTPISTRW